MSLRTRLQAVGVGVIVVGVAGAAVLASGYEVQQTELTDSGVWAVQQSGNRFAKVNTRLGELELVRGALDLDELVQTESAALVYARERTLVARIDRRMPVDLAEDTLYENPPGGTAEAAVEGEWVVYRTQDGGVYLGGLAAGAGLAASALDPYAGEEPGPDGQRPRFTAAAIALSPAGLVFMFSAEEGLVLRYDLRRAAFTGEDRVEGVAAGAPVSLTAVGDRWVLLDGSGALRWAGLGEPVQLQLGGDTLLQRPAASGDAVLLADASALRSVGFGDRAVRVEFTPSPAGVPARPVQWQGRGWAAWVAADGSSGSLWNSVDGGSQLDLGGGPTAEAGEPAPVFQLAGGSAVLNETASGAIWTLPGGALVPSSLDWSLGIDQQQAEERVDASSRRLTEPHRPIAVDDEFGVRPGSVALLPVLLNDYDPNGDVLALVPGDGFGLDDGFGSARLVQQGQAIAVTVRADAQGSARLSYRVSDGTKADGLRSDPATVLLHATGRQHNTAPQHCSDLGGECLQPWPEPQLQPGAAVTVPVLAGWVDAEGDPVYLRSAVLSGTAPGTVIATAAGEVVYRHPDPNGAAGVVTIRVVVADALGAEREKELRIRVTPSPSLQLEPFALLAVPAQSVTIDPSPWLDGVTGSWRITSAKTGDGQSAAVELDGERRMRFLAETPGEYQIGYTVADGATERASTVRVSVLPDEQAAISVAPVTVFVHGKVDTTIDVLPAVHNPAGRPLVLTSAQWRSGLGNGAGNEVEVVEQRLLRVRNGGTGSGLVGVIRYELSDGSGSALGRAQGEAAVVALDPVAEPLPIAVDDQVTVRASEQIDVPVLANDISPAGTPILLRSDWLEYDEAIPLAFASGELLRVLAPSTPGEYELRYRIGSLGYAEQTDTAVVRLTVLPGGENAAPEPPPLSARVVAGGSVLLPLPIAGLDPDGDAVRLDRVTRQPTRGAASITPDGRALRYDSLLGDQGLLDFEYRVRDARGLTATAVAQVLVLDQLSNPSPVAFSDYVEVGRGEGNSVLVQPLRNDIDPNGSPLRLVSVEPDADPETQPEQYAALQALITELGPDSVRFSAGAEAATHTFRYTIENALGDRSIGLVVLRVVRDAIADAPRVTDTVLTVADRASFTSAGIDVVAGKVAWNAGEAAALRLEFWGEPPAGFRTIGGRIAGPLPERRVTIPFQLSGSDFAGRPAVGYGFLQLPGADELLPVLAEPVVAPVVEEFAEGVFDLAALVPVPPGAVLELDPASVQASGQRAEASCAFEAGTAVRYRAGGGAPWRDSCLVGLRYGADHDVTVLAVPIEVPPAAPQPELRTAALMHSPASPTLEFDLRSMVQWRGAEAWDSLVIAVDESASRLEHFTVTREGDLLRLFANDRAVPGSEEVIPVRLESHPDAAPAALRLRVGPAPTTTPRGGHVEQLCRQDDGSSCLAPVIGVSALERNIYRSAQLAIGELLPGTCTGMTFAIEGGGIRVSWTDATDGQRCELPFSVVDPQGLRSAPGDEGVLSLDFRGYPKPAQSVVQTRYEAASIRLRVTPAPTPSYPVVDGFRIFEGGQQIALCTADGSCPVITADGAGAPLVSGQERVYRAVATSEGGDSRASVQTTAWPLALPTMDPDPEAVPVYTPGQTTATQGTVRFGFDTHDPTTARYELRLIAGGQIYPLPSGGATQTIALPVGVYGSATLRPVSQYPIPPGATTTQVQASVTLLVRAAGSPTGLAVGSVTESGTELAFAGGSAAANSSAAPVTIRYVVTPAASGVSPCSAAADGGIQLTGAVADRSGDGGIGTGSLAERVRYRAWTCAGNGFGVISAQLDDDVMIWQVPAAPDTSASRFVIAKDGDAYLAESFTAPVPAAPTGFQLVYRNYDLDAARATQWGVPLDLGVRACVIGSPERCGPEAAITADRADRQHQVRLLSPSARCSQSGLDLTAEGNGGLGTRFLSGSRVTYDWFMIPMTVHPSAVPWSSVNEVRQLELDVGFAGLDDWYAIDYDSPGTLVCSG